MSCIALPDIEPVLLSALFHSDALIKDMSFKSSFNIIFNQLFS